MLYWSKIGEIFKEQSMPLNWSLYMQSSGPEQHLTASQALAEGTKTLNENKFDDALKFCELGLKIAGTDPILKLKLLLCKTSAGAFTFFFAKEYQTAIGCYSATIKLIEMQKSYCKLKFCEESPDTSEDEKKFNEQEKEFNSLLGIAHARKGQIHYFLSLNDQKSNMNEIRLVSENFQKAMDYEMGNYARGLMQIINYVVNHLNKLPQNKEKQNDASLFTCAEKFFEGLKQFQQENYNGAFALFSQGLDYCHYDPTLVSWVRKAGAACLKSYKIDLKKPSGFLDKKTQELWNARIKQHPVEAKKILYTIQRYLAFKNNYRLEKLSIIKDATAHWLRLNVRYMPLTENYINNFAKKLEHYKGQGDKFNKAIIWQLKKHRAKLPPEAAAFEQALDCFYQTIQNENLLNFYSSSQHSIQGEALLSKKSMMNANLEYKSDSGLISEKLEKNYLFAYCSAECPQPLQAENDGLRTFVFDGRLTAKNCYMFIREEDVTVYYHPHSVILKSHYFGSVYYQQSTAIINNHHIKKTTTVGPDGERHHYYDKTLRQIATEKTIFDVAALDVIKMLRRVHAADPLSAKKVLSVFYPVVDSKRDNHVIRQRRIEKAKELCRLNNKYEVSIVSRLPFVVSEKKETHSLLKMIYEVDANERDNFFNAIEKGDIELIKEMIKQNQKQAACYSLQDNNVPIIKNPFLASARRKNPDTEEVETALIYAIRKKQTAIIKLLLEQGADVHARQEFVSVGMGYAFGCDALMTAAEMGDLETVKLLVENYGANLGALKSHSANYSLNANALSLAKKSGRHYVAKYLLEQGAKNVDGSKVFEFKGSGVVINGHGEKTNRTFDLKQLGHALITPDSLTISYIFSVPRDFSIEKDLIFSQRSTILKAIENGSWTRYCDDKAVPDVELYPWRANELNLFAVKVLRKGLWQQIDGNSDYYMNRDPAACLVVKAPDNTYLKLYGDDCKKYLEGLRFYNPSKDGIPLCFYAPAVKKIKILGKTSLSEVLTQVDLPLQENIILAACNAGANPKFISLIVDNEIEKKFQVDEDSDLLESYSDLTPQQIELLYDFHPSKERLGPTSHFFKLPKAKEQHTLPKSRVTI